MRMALEEVSGGAGNPVQLETGWKLFLLLPRILLHRPPRWVEVQIDRTIRQICSGRVVQLLHASVQCDEQAAVVRRRKGRRGDDLERRAIRALNFVQLGELSSASQALEGAEIAPGTEDILTALRKSGGGVRGIVAGDVVRRLVSRTIALWNQRLRSATLSPLPKNTDYFVLLCLPWRRS